MPSPKSNLPSPKYTCQGVANYLIYVRLLFLFKLSLFFYLEYQSNKKNTHFRSFLDFAHLLSNQLAFIQVVKRKNVMKLFFLSHCYSISEEIFILMSTKLSSDSPFSLLLCFFFWHAQQSCFVLLVWLLQAPNSRSLYLAFAYLHSM